MFLQGFEARTSQGELQLPNPSANSQNAGSERTSVVNGNSTGRAADFQIKNWEVVNVSAKLQTHIVDFGSMDEIVYEFHLKHMKHSWSWEIEIPLHPTESPKVLGSKTPAAATATLDSSFFNQRVSAEMNKQLHSLATGVLTLRKLGAADPDSHPEFYAKLLKLAQQAEIALPPLREPGSAGYPTD